jgi:hypothetical protein
MDRDKRDNLILLKPKYLFSRLTLGGTLSLRVYAQAINLQNFTWVCHLSSVISGFEMVTMHLSMVIITPNN